MQQSIANPQISPKFFVFKKRSTSIKLIFGTHLKIIQAVDHNSANKFLDQWNKQEIENQTTHVWDPMVSDTLHCSKYKYGVLFCGNSWTDTHTDIREAVFKAVNDWDFCTEFPVSLEFTLPYASPGKTCGYTVYFEETHIGEFRERMEKFKKNEKIRQAIEEYRIEQKSPKYKNPPPYDNNDNNGVDIELQMRRQRGSLEIGEKKSICHLLPLISI